MKCRFSGDKESISRAGWKTFTNKCFLSLNAVVNCNGNKDKKNCPFWVNSQK